MSTKEERRAMNDRHRFPLFGRLATALFAAIAVSAPALLRAQEATSGAEEAPADFRGKVTLAYGIVFGVIVIFLVLSMRRNAGMAEEVEFLEKRLDELQKR